MFSVGERLVLSLWDRAAFEAELGAPVLDGTRRGAVDACAQRRRAPRTSARCWPSPGVAGAPVWGPIAREWGGFTGYFADPDGFRWEVAWNPGPIGRRVVPDTDVDARP